MVSPTESLVTQTLVNAFTINICTVILVLDFIHLSSSIFLDRLLELKIGAG